MIFPLPEVKVVSKDNYEASLAATHDNIVDLLFA